MKYRRWVVLVVIAAAMAGVVVYAKLRPAVAAVPDASTTTTATSATGGTSASGKPTHAGGGGGRASGAGARSGGAPPIAVQTVAAGEQTVPITKDYVGTIEPVASVAVRTRITGVIVSEAVSEGQTVKKGDLLFQLDDQAIQATIAKDQATVAKDQAVLAQGNADLARDQTLTNQGDVTAQALQEQQATVKVDQANVASDQAALQADQVQLGYAKVYAPIDGRVGAISVTPGNLVATTDQNPVLTITQMAPIEVSFDAPERDLDAFQTALKGASPPPVSILDPDTGKARATGTLTFIDSSVDSTSGTVLLKGQFANADLALWPGSYVRVEAQIGAYDNATVVPSEAVQLSDTSSFVYLVKPDATVTKQTVQVADTVGDTSVISSGLKPGDHVVVEGQLRLSEGARIKETLVPSAVASAGSGAAPVTTVSGG